MYTILNLYTNARISYLVHLFKYCFGVTLVGYVHNLKPVHKCTYFIFGTFHSAVHLLRAATPDDGQPRSMV